MLGLAGALPEECVQISPPLSVALTPSHTAGSSCSFTALKTLFTFSEAARVVLAPYQSFLTSGLSTDSNISASARVRCVEPHSLNLLRQPRLMWLLRFRRALVFQHSSGSTLTRFASAFHRIQVGWP